MRRTTFGTALGLAAGSLLSVATAVADPPTPKSGIPGAKAPPPTYPPTRTRITEGGYYTAPPVQPTAPRYSPQPPPAPKPWVAPPCPPPCAPPVAAPCPAPCGCFQPRDACGWPIDHCGRRYGVFEVTLEGMWSTTLDPVGPFGEQTYGAGNQIAWGILNYSGKFGGRGTIAYHTSPEDRLEARGTYYGKWDDSGSTTGVFGASTGSSGTGDVSRSTIADLSDEAKAWGFEVNWWHEISCSGHWRTDVGLGFRYVRFDETARADLLATGSGPFPVAPGFVNADVEDQFAGAQLMGALHLDASETFELGLSLKALVGNMDRKIDVSDDSVFAGGLHSASSKDDEIVFGFDAEVGFRWRFTSWLALTGGYDLLFLDGVQRAHQAMDFSHSASGAVQAQQDPDQLLIHSLFLGLNFNF